jgi:hypothetical protein
MTDPETPCPECSGAGFFGNNGPIAETICGFCKGAGVLVEESAYRHLSEPQRKPVGRELDWLYKQIFWQREERRQRDGS